MDAERREGKLLSHRDARLIVLGMLLPTFMGSLDNTILANALPTIGRDFGETHDLPWLITAYLLASTAAIPLYGKIADIHGRRFTLRIALLIYMAGSLVCALAPSMTGLGYLHWSMIFWINIPMGLAALAITNTLLAQLPRHERPHQLDFIGAGLIVIASVSFMLAMNMAGGRYPWVSAPILALLAAALVMGALFVLRLLTAPEPLIPISILKSPILRCAIVANACGWGAIMGLNVLLPIYLQGAMGISPSQAGLSLMAFMVALNTSAGLAGQVLGRVRHYKLLPMVMLSLSILAVTVLALHAERITLFWFELLLIVIGAGFGPIPSLTAVAMQNVVARHEFGISVSSMNFSRNLYATMLIAVFGALALGNSLAGESLRGALAGAAANAAEGFGRVFLVAAASFSIALIAIIVMEERPLLTEADLESG